MNLARNRFCRIAFVLVFLALSTEHARADSDYQTFTFDNSRLKSSKISGYDVIRYGDLELSREIAAPQVPVKLVRLALPPGKRIASVRIEELDSEELEGRYRLFPTQAPQPLSRPEVEFIEPADRFYSSTDLFPSEVVQVAPRGYFSGYNIGALLVHPVQYLPAQQKLIFHSRIVIRIFYEDSGRLPLPYRTTTYSESIHKSALTKLVKNPRSLMLPAVRMTLAPSALPPEDHLYVIITSDALAPSFEPLADWKNKKGLSAEIVTTAWIYANYSGVDDQARIREFIKDAYQNWGTLWVLLGGDTNVVPERLAYAMDCEMGLPSDNEIPCDLYYADLDSDWNENGNSVYGELDDNVDMYPDVFVGRASVEDAAEASTFVDKILTYEVSGSNGHALDMLFLAEILWSDPYTDSSIGKDSIDDLYVPNRFDPITKLYASAGNESPSSVIAALNAGQNIVNHDGHAWYTLMGVGTGYLTLSDMDALTNGPEYSLLFSIGCWPAAFDYDCIAEHFVSNPNGGGVAFVGNSRYGWGSPGNPKYGYSDRFDQQFFKSLFDDGIYHIGNTLAAAKAAYVVFSGQENVYRWCEYQINLLGDPEMPIWTDTPQALVVTHADELHVGDSLFPITVTAGSSPVAGALVCIMQNTSVYEVGLTDNDGQVSFNISTADAANPVHITVTARDSIPYEGTASMVTDEPYVKISSYATDGSSEGYVTPDSLATMDASFKNYGSVVASSVSVVLSSSNAKISIVDGEELVGDIPAGDSMPITGAFSFHVDSSLANGETAYLDAALSDTADHAWTDIISVTGAMPVLSFTSYEVADYQHGDEDGFAEPGERVTLLITVENSGLETAQAAVVTVGCADSDVDILDTSMPLGSIPASGSQIVLVDVAIDPLCPAPSFPQIDLLFEAEGGYVFDDSFLISIGEIGFEDDMEDGDSNWAHSGSIDLWHLTTNRAHSGDNSWYCGTEDPFVYVDNMENVLELTPIEIGQEAALSFWCWYEFPTYGSDGLYAEVNDGSGWTTLDFIGSGGALNPLNIGNDWLEYAYDLSHYPAGTSLTLRFRFVSDDEDVAEGAYVDDVMIVGAEWPDEVPSAPIPTLSEWGLMIMTVLLAAAGVELIRRRNPADKPGATR